MRYIVYCFLIIPALAMTLFFPVGTSINSIATSILAGLILFYIDLIVLSWKNAKIIFWQLKYWNVNIRLSISYLYQVKIDDQYLLIKSDRRNSYQPPGGVYKRLADSDAFFTNISALDDNLIPLDVASEGDLRMQIKGKYLLQFIRWFESGKGREISPWREFYEELIQTNILSSSNFPYVYYRFIRRHWAGVKYSHFTNGPELLVADIFELLPKPNQLEELKNLNHSYSDQIIFADADSIRRNGVVPKKSLETTIGDHTKWIL